MPSLRHQFLAWAIPRMRKAQELETPEIELERVRAWHATLDRTFPTKLVKKFDQQFTLETEQLEGPGGTFPSYVVTPRGSEPRRTVFYLHGGAFMAGIDPFQVRYACRLATTLGARVVVPDYPLTPEHTWADSHAAIADQAARWTAASDDLVLVGDSSGGGYALAVAETLRDRGGPQPSRMVLHAPWADLTTSTPETEEFARRDPWLHIGKLRLYAACWAGSDDDLGRPEVSPALGDLTGLPRTLMFCGTRDLLAPGCRLLARRGAEAGWDLTYVERPDLIHVYSIMPLIPEAKDAWRQTVEFLR